MRISENDTGTVTLDMKDAFNTAGERIHEGVAAEFANNLSDRMKGLDPTGLGYSVQLGDYGRNRYDIRMRGSISEIKGVLREIFKNAAADGSVILSEGPKLERSGRNTQEMTLTLNQPYENIAKKLGPNPSR